MISEEMVEKAARAMRESDRSVASGRWNEWERAKPDHRENYLRRARAALSACNDGDAQKMRADIATLKAALIQARADIDSIGEIGNVNCESDLARIDAALASLKEKQT